MTILFDDPPLPPVDSDPKGMLSARQQYAVAIWAWTRAHPRSTYVEFMDMLDRAERLAARVRSEGETYEHNGY